MISALSSLPGKDLSQCYGAAVRAASGKRRGAITPLRRPHRGPSRTIVIIASPARSGYAPAMRRAAVIVLVLMGGGVLLSAARPWSSCREAREHQLDDADEICRQAGYSGGGGFHLGSTSGEHASVSRGGFGASGHAAHGS
jgi:hypothetical protein